MNGVHDMGGLQCFGPVEPEADEPVFHAAWERRAFALTLAMTVPGGWPLDAARYARESLPPAQYLASSYYEIWLAALERMMVERGLVSGAELAAGRAVEPPKPVKRILKAEEVAATLGRGGPALRDATTPARFAVGERVLAKTMNPLHHTRLPRYARGRTGMIARIHGCHVFPDTNAHGEGEQPQWLYGVEFAATELWGREARDGDCVHADLWEPYLEPA